MEYKYKLKRVMPGTWRDYRTQQTKDYYHVILAVKCPCETPEEVLEYCKGDLIDPYGEVKIRTQEEVNRVLFRGAEEWSECFNVVVSALDDEMWELDLHCYHFHRYAPNTLRGVGKNE